MLNEKCLIKTGIREMAKEKEEEVNTSEDTGKVENRNDMANNVIGSLEFKTLMQGNYIHTKV